MKILPLVFQSILSVALLGHARAAMYQNDFSTTGFTTENDSGDWTVSAGAYQDVYTGNNTVSSASVEIVGVNGTSFTMSSQFTINSYNPGTTSSASTLGFGLMGADSDFGGGSSGTAYYLADFGYAYGTSASTKGGLRILALGDASGFTSTATSNNFDGNTANLAVTEDETYTLKLTGTYNGSGHLELSFGLFDSTGTTQFGSSATAIDTTPLLGTHFGYRNRTASNSSSATNLNASFDNFSVATIPEPSTVVLSSIVMLGFLIFGRRRMS
ncbi:PEP-CTERM sorting domain-containing protein [Kiritimatiellota bacterium B12222]|nr:PEP-CTERM sorting domain-containing protein [Kiritimatiellota bacterium B12222]